MCFLFYTQGKLLILFLFLSMFGLCAEIKHFMNIFSFSLVLMTVKGSKCEFTLHWLKTGKENKILRNAFIYSPSNTVTHPRPCRKNAPILFS